jgi:hypothetical protein
MQEAVEIKSIDEILKQVQDTNKTTTNTNNNLNNNTNIQAQMTQTPAQVVQTQVQQAPTQAIQTQAPTQITPTIPQTNQNIQQTNQPTSYEKQNNTALDNTSNNTQTNQNTSTPLPQQLFQNVIKAIYDQDYELGKCFEDSFLFSSFNNHILKLNSIASGDCRTKLYKYFANIKLTILNIFGDETQIEFEKITKKPTKDTVRIIKPSKPILTNEQIINSIDPQPSSCVASMVQSDISKPSEANIDIKTILKSDFIDTAKKLFQPRNELIINSKI